MAPLEAIAPLDVLCYFLAVLFLFALFSLLRQKHACHSCTHPQQYYAEHHPQLLLAPSCAPSGTFPNWAVDSQHACQTRFEIPQRQQTSLTRLFSSPCLVSKPIHGTVAKGDEGLLALPGPSQIHSLSRDLKGPSSDASLVPPNEKIGQSFQTMESVQGSDNAGSTQEQLQLLKKRIESLEGTILSMQAVERLLEHRVVSLEKLEHRILSLEKKVNNDPAYVSGVRDVKSNKETRTVSFHAHQDSSVLKTHNDKTLHAKALHSTIPSSSAASSDEPSPRRTGHHSDLVQAIPPGCLLDDEKQHVCNAPVLTPDRAATKPTASSEDDSSVPDLLIMDSAGEAKRDLWDGKIHWAMENLFDSQSEEVDAMLNRDNILPGTRLVDQWVFQYGLRYIPGPNETDVYRTVKIEGLPLDATMDQVLGQVCCGDVYSAQFLDTKDITGYHTAIIIFLHQHQAENFARYAAKAGISVNDVRLKVTLINTPTYPMPAKMEKLIEDGHTRCVALGNFRPELMETLQFVMQRWVYNDYIECIEDGWEDNKICVLFHSIRIAGAAYDHLNNHPSFHGCQTRFAVDPCRRSPE